MSSVERWLANADGSRCCWIRDASASDRPVGFRAMLADHEAHIIDLRGGELGDAVASLEPWDDDPISPFHHVTGWPLVVATGWTRT